MARIVAVEVEPDKLLRTCLVRYNLMQDILKEDRLCYKGVHQAHHGGHPWLLSLRPGLC
jgi:hypothetical protein